MGKRHLTCTQNQQRLRKIFKVPPLISYRKGKSLKDELVRAKLWRSDNFLNDQVQESCVARRQFLNLVTWDVSKFDSMLSRWSPTKTQLKKAIKLPSNRYLPTPNVSFSPSSLHFRHDFPFLLTFSGHFFLPILFLSPQNKGGVGGRLGYFVREKFVFQTQSTVIKAARLLFFGCTYEAVNSIWDLFHSWTVCKLFFL